MVDSVSLICSRRVLHYSTCETISAPLVRLILDQSEVYNHAPEVNKAQTRMRNTAQKLHRQYEARTANDLKENPSNKMQKTLTVCSEEGVSCWLLLYPSWNMGLPCIRGIQGCFVLAIWLATILFTLSLCLWPPFYFTIKHAFSCSRGKFPSIHHTHTHTMRFATLWQTC